MIAVKVEIVRFVDGHQPGWVQCRLTDVHGQDWRFVEKVPIVTAEHLDGASDYPQPGVIACVVVGRPQGNVVEIDTEHPWGVEATDGGTRFVVRADQLTDLD